MADTYFRVSLYLMRLSGVPLCMPAVPKLRILYNTISTASLYITYLCVVLNLVFSEDHEDEYMKSVRMFFPMSSLVWMHSFTRFSRRDIEYLIRLADSFNGGDFPDTDPDTGNSSMTGYIPTVNNLTMYGWMFLAVFHAIQSAIRMLTSRSMMFTTWYPFDASVSPRYELVNLSQVLSSIVCISICVGFPCLYATLVCVACSQLEQLRASLLDIRQTQRDCGTQEAQGQAPASQQLFRHMQKQLNSCIRHHQEIKRYMAALEDTICFVVCGLFLLMLASMCFSAYSAVLSWGDSTDVSQALVLYCSMLSIVFVFCWLGNQLSEQAERVRDAAWGCDWVGTPVPFQRCLAFIIATANKEFTLTAGKFVPVSNVTMMHMINQTVSFFMFLLQMKNKNEESNEATYE